MHSYKSIVLFFFTHLLICQSQSQIISASLFASTINRYEDNELTLISSMGEPVIGTIENDIIINQGFYSSSRMLITSITNDLHSQILLFPNPTKDKLFFKTNYQSEYEIYVYDLQNSLVIKKRNVDHISLSKLKNGIYFVEIRSVGKRETAIYRILKID